MPLDITGNFCFLTLCKHTASTVPFKGIHSCTRACLQSWCLLFVLSLSPKPCTCCRSSEQLLLIHLLCATQFYRFQPCLPWVTTPGPKRCSPLLVLKLFSGKFFDPPCCTLWILSRSAALLFGEGIEVNRVCRAALTSRHSQPSILQHPRKSQDSQKKKILQCCHKDSNLYHLI